MKLLVYGWSAPRVPRKVSSPRSARTIEHTLIDVFYEEIKKVKVPITIYEFLLLF